MLLLGRNVLSKLKIYKTLSFVMCSRSVNKLLKDDTMERGLKQVLYEVNNNKEGKEEC